MEKKQFPFALDQKKESQKLRKLHKSGRGLSKNRIPLTFGRYFHIKFHLRNSKRDEILTKLPIRAD